MFSENERIKIHLKKNSYMLNSFALPDLGFLTSNITSQGIFLVFTMFDFSVNSY